MTKLIANVTACLLCPFRLRRGFASFLEGTGVFIVSTLVAVNTELVGPRYLALFTPLSRKCCLIGRVITSWRVSGLAVTRFRARRGMARARSVVRGGRFIVIGRRFVGERGRFTGGLASLGTIKSEEDLFKDSNRNGFLIKLSTCFQAFSFASVDWILFHLVK